MPGKKTVYILFHFVLFFISCNGQEKSRSDKLTIQKIDQQQEYIINEILPISIDTITNFQLLDEIPPYPSYRFYNKTIEAYITIAYKGKDNVEQNYWSVYNPNGYFAEYKNFEEPYLLNKEIKKHLIERGVDNYNVTASIVYRKDIKNYYSEDDIEYKPDASLYRYLFQNNKWKFDKSVKIKEIENNLLN